jgi:probable HAF family extracellular repeat protein
MRCRAIALGGWLLAASSLLWGQSGGAIRWLGIGAREHVGAVIDSPFVVGPASTRLWNPDSIRWTVVRPPAGYSDMELYDISWDGRVLSGWVREAASGKEFLIRLRREDGGYEVTLPEWGAVYKVIFVAISGDGRICGGRMVHRFDGDTALFLWRGGDTLWESYSRAVPVDIFDLSWDGSIAVGRTRSLYYGVFPYPARYIYNPTRRQWEERVLMNVGGGATGVSADGRVIVGWIIDRAFRYTEQEGVRWLPGLPSSVENRAFAVSADGQIIVGSSQLRYAATSRAVRWVNGVVEDLNEVYGALLQDSSVLYDARAISPSGRYVIGTGYNGRTRQKEWYLLELWGNNAPRAAYQVSPADSARVAPQPVLEMWGADIEQDSLRFVVELL